MQRIPLLTYFFIVLLNTQILAAPPTNQLAAGASEMSSKKYSYKHTEEQPITAMQIEEDSEKNYCLYMANRCLISIAPYLGIDSKALVLIPFYNQDAQLLQQWKKIEDLSNQAPPPPLLEISGIGSLQVGANIINRQLRDWVFNQNSIELDLSSHIPWVTAFIDFTSSQSVDAVQLVARPNIYLDRAFLTIGNLNASPLYTTLGKRYVPFGQYYSYMISGSIAQSLGKIKANSLLLGYQPLEDKGLYGSLYSFKSDKIMYGSTIGFKATTAAYTVDLGVDWIQNMVSAQALQTVLSNPNNVTMPGLDYHARMGIHNIYLLAEYTMTLHPFNNSVLSYYTGRAMPAAFNLETAYEFKAFEKVSSLAVGYGETKQSAALGLPAKRYTVTYNIAPWKNIIISAQYQHNVDYPLGASAINTNPIAAPAANTIFGKITFYF